jgi:hypothetical protein
MRPRVLAVALLLAGCYPGGLQKGTTPARPSHVEARGCSVDIFDAAPTDRASVDKGNVHVYADLTRVDENWAIEALAAQTCALGGNALVLSPDGDALPAARVMHRDGSRWVSFQGRALRLTAAPH